MTFKRIVNYTVLVFVLISCSSANINKTLKQGCLIQENFKTIIPFTYTNNGWVVLEVVIKDETYNFILDTGASNVISEDLANKLNLEVLGTEKIQDINSLSNQINYTSIDSIKIKGLDFEETVFGILEFKKIAELDCIKIDGIIGSNLMRKAIWDFNFDEQLITIVDDEEKLNIPNNSTTTKMYIGVGGIPSITLKVNGRKELNNTIDLGNAGSNLLRIDHFEKQLENNLIHKYVKGDQKAWGGFGRAESKPFYHAIVNSLTIGNYTATNIFTVANTGSGNNLGLSFFKNYRVILNWNKKKMTLIEKHSPSTNSYESFGFTTLFNDKSIFVNAIIKKSNASQYLKQGDKILSINEVNYTNLENEDYCDFLNNDSYRDNKTIAISIIRDNQKRSFKFEKNIFFKKH